MLFFKATTFALYHKKNRTSYQYTHTHTHTYIHIHITRRIVATQLIHPMYSQYHMLWSQKYLSHKINTGTKLYIPLMSVQLSYDTKNVQRQM